MRKGKEKAYLEIKLSELELGPLHIDCEFPIEWLKTRMSFCEYSAQPLTARVVLDVQTTGNGILIRGHVNSQIETFCGTCLEKLNIEVRPTINAYLVPKSAISKEREDIELTPEDFDREYYDGNTIVLDEIIGDAVMLELPMNPKCVGVCNGLKEFSRSSKQQEIDPRLAPLLGIQIKKEN